MARLKEFDENEVLIKAMNLFRKKGFEATSMNDMVEELGINRSSLYDTYGDKRALYISSLKYYRDHFAEKMVEAFNQSASIVDTFRNLFNSVYNECITDKDRMGCFIVNASIEILPHDQEIAKLISDNNLRIEEAMVNAIVRAQKTGEIKSEKDPRSLARFYMNTVNGLRILAKTSADPAAIRDVIEVALSVIEVKGLREKGSA